MLPFVKPAHVGFCKMLLKTIEGVMVTCAVSVAISPSESVKVSVYIVVSVGQTVMEL
jgi:hypothetical protein